MREFDGMDFTLKMCTIYFFNMCMFLYFCVFKGIRSRICVLQFVTKHSKLALPPQLKRTRYWWSHMLRIWQLVVTFL